LSQDHNNEEEKTIRCECGLPIFGAIMKNKDAEERAEGKSTPTHEERQLTLQTKILRTQIGLLFFGLIGAGIGGWQANISQQSADTSDKSVLLAQKSERESRRASEDQARQSAKAFDASIDNFKLEQRPWISIRSVDTPGLVGPFKQQGTTWTRMRFDSVEVKLTNSGRTPALNISQSVLVTDRGWLDKVPTYESAIKERDKAEKELKATGKAPAYRTWVIETRQHNGWIVAPDDTQKATVVPDDLSFDLYKARNNRPGNNIRDIVYVIGYFTYYDVLSPKKHTTKFCLESNGAAFQLCHDGNWME
jgi:hypothetical protein